MHGDRLSGGRGNGRDRSRAALCRSRRRVLRGAFRFRGGLRVRHALQMVLYLFRDIRGNRARVRLLFRDAKARQEVNDGFRLDLELARQLVNANLG